MGVRFSFLYGYGTVEFNHIDILYIISSHIGFSLACQDRKRSAWIFEASPICSLVFMNSSNQR